MLKDFLDFNDLKLEEWEHIFNLAGEIYDNPGNMRTFTGINFGNAVL